MSKGKTTRLAKRSLDALLSLDRVRELLRYERTTGALFWKCGAKKGRRADTGGCPRYRRVTIDGVRFQAHRVIWFLVNGRFPAKGEVDHRDRNGHNNRWRNLREATRNEQMLNIRTHRDNRAGLKWVRTTAPGKYQASVQLCLGTYRSPREAHEVAKQFVRAHHGAFFNAGAAL